MSFDLGGPLLDLGAALVDLGAALGAEPGAPGMAPHPLCGHVLVTGAHSGTSRTVAAILRHLTAVGVPWMRVGRDRGTAGSGAAVVLDLADPHGIPVTLDPLWPEPGFPVSAHAGLLCSVWQAAFGLQDRVRDVLALGLRGAYTASGWDWLTGGPGPRPGAAGHGVPTSRQLAAATAEAAAELKGDADAATAAMAFIRARLQELRSDGPGLFLGGGHPVASGRLLATNVDVVTGDADEEGRALLAGTVLLRIAERARLSHVSPAARPRHALVIEEAGALLTASRAGERVAGLIAALVDQGELVVLAHRDAVGLAAGIAGRAAVTITHPRPGRAAMSWASLEREIACHVPEDRADPGGSSAGRLAELGLIAARRSPGCGDTCTQARPCNRYEISAGHLLAAGREAAWLRLWAQTLVLAFLTGRPLPRVPPALRLNWAELEPRLRECALATLVDRAVAGRAPALRAAYSPQRLTAAAAGVATALLDGRPAPPRAGQVWVPPQLRWAHEAARVGWACPDRRRPADVAPPLDFRLSGLPDWPGIRAGERLGLLRQHPLSMDIVPNRELARTALRGDGWPDFDADLAGVVGSDDRSVRLREAGAMMACPGGWLETVLSWPAG